MIKFANSFFHDGPFLTWSVSHLRVVTVGGGLIVEVVNLFMLTYLYMGPFRLTFLIKSESIIVSGIRNGSNTMGAISS